jgi:hypothetical protein
MLSACKPVQPFLLDVFVLALLTMLYIETYLSYSLVD